MEYINLEEFPKDMETIFINSKGLEFDLHNNADFYSFEYDVCLRKVFLRWKFPGKWFMNNFQTFGDDYANEFNIKKNKQRIFSLILHDVVYCELKPRDNEMPFSEDRCLDGIAFDYSSKTERLVFRFWSGTEIRVEAEKIEFIDGK